jgi:cell division protease FtsH
VRALIEEADGRARSILEAHRDDLETGVELLIAKETLTVEDFPPLRGITPRESVTDQDDEPSHPLAPAH